jgi:MraZ protein
MPDSGLILGEFKRTVDERFRLTLPQELLDPLGLEDDQIVMVKERPGCISLWNDSQWQSKLETDLQVLASKLKGNRFATRQRDLQTLGRLLSTRHRIVPLAGRSRLVIPEGFREFLAIEPATDVFIVGAAVCVEIWKTEAWRDCLNEQMPTFRELMTEMTE